MRDVVNVVVTCTKDKRHPVVKSCMLRSLPSGSLADRFREWKGKVSRKSGEKVLVKELYAGDHWATVQSFSSSRFEIDVWVCSAGFGLVRLDDLITPYSATFSSKHPDSVTSNLIDCSASNATSKWWEKLSNWKSQFKERPRSLTELCLEFPKRSTLIVTSETYLRAVASDLKKAIAGHSDPDRLSIVSSGVKTFAGLDDHLIPCDARLQNEVNGALRSLNTRIARKILSEARVPPSRSALTRKYRILLNKQPPIPIYNRLQQSDDNICNFIMNHLLKDKSLTHTKLLRCLRDSNKACEQKRFARLFREVWKEKYDS